MQNIFFQAICRVGIFMICAQAIVHFRPQETYEKYLKLLVSIMVLIQLFLPVGSFFWGDGKREAAEALESFRQELEENMRDAEKEAGDMDEMLRQMTLEEVRRQAVMLQENRQDTQKNSAVITVRVEDVDLISVDSCGNDFNSGNHGNNIAEGNSEREE